MAKAGEHQANSRPAGWQLAGPGGSRGWRPGHSQEKKRLREGSGCWLSYTYHLGGRASMEEAEILRECVPHRTDSPRGSSAHCVLGAEGRKDLREAVLWPEAEPFRKDAHHTGVGR